MQVAFGLLGQGLVLVQLGLGLVDAGLVDLGVDDEEGLSAADIGSLLEEHPFEEALDPCADLDELLGADASHVFPVDLDVVRPDGFDRHNRVDRLRRFGPEHPPESSGDQNGDDCQYQPRAFGETADPAAGFPSELQRAATRAGRLLYDFLA